MNSHLVYRGAWRVLPVVILLCGVRRAVGQGIGQGRKSGMVGGGGALFARGVGQSPTGMANFEPGTKGLGQSIYDAPS